MSKERAARRIVELGPTVGFHHGRSIPAHYVTQVGTRHEFNRTAVETDGGIELAQLAPDESVIAPGLIYREVKL